MPTQSSPHPTHGPPRIRVLIVDEVRLMGNVTASVLKTEHDLEVVGCATTLDEALALAPASDVALVSSSMPNEDALTLTKTLVRTVPSSKVIVTGLSDAESAILRYIEAGVSGYVLKDDSVDTMLTTLHAVLNGEAVISPSIAAALMTRLTELAELAKTAGAQPAPPTEPLPDLT
ncbi:MAG: response regulator transcription factor, partial [Chloroflexi bacterium]|nr:response regulator transcription factor [Chloroflexota bacterium]